MSPGKNKQAARRCSTYRADTGGIPASAVWAQRKGVTRSNIYEEQTIREDPGRVGQ